MSTATQTWIEIGWLILLCGALLVALGREVVRIIRETKVLKSFKGFSGITMKERE